MAKMQNYIRNRKTMIFVNRDTKQVTLYLQKRRADLPRLLFLSFLKICKAKIMQCYLR